MLFIRTDMVNRGEETWSAAGTTPVSWWWQGDIVFEAWQRNRL